IDEIVARSGKLKETLLPEDISMYLPEDMLFEDLDLITQDNIDMLFFLYLFRKASLEYSGSDLSNLGEAPWDILNKVINAAGLPYALTVPSEEPIKALFRSPLNKHNPDR